jgi:hypothetical protein
VLFRELFDAVNDRYCWNDHSILMVMLKHAGVELLLSGRAAFRCCLLHDILQSYCPEVTEAVWVLLCARYSCWDPVFEGRVDPLIVRV